METWPPPLVRDERKVTWQTDEEVRTTPSFIVQLPCAGHSPQRERLLHNLQMQDRHCLMHDTELWRWVSHALCSVLKAVEP